MLKKITLLIVFSVITSGIAFAGILWGPVVNDANVGPDLSTVSYISYINSDQYILTESLDNYTVNYNQTNISRWEINSGAFPNATESGSFTIIFHNKQKTASVVGAQYTNLTQRIPAQGLTKIDQPATLNAPVILVTPGNAKNAITWNSISGATQYKLYRSTTNNGYFEKINDQAVSPYNDEGLNNGTTYYYLLIAAANGLTSPHSAVVSGTPDGNIVEKTLQSLTISPAQITLKDGQAQAFAVTAHYSDNTDSQVSNNDITYSLSSGAIGTLVGNTYTAPDVIAVDSSLKVTASYQGKIADATINLSKKQLLSIAITPAGPISLPQGGTQQFRAYATYDNNDTPIEVTGSVSWSTDTGTIDNAGLFTATEQKNGTISTLLEERLADVSVNVDQETLSTVVINSVSSAKAGDSITFTVSGKDAQGNPVGISNRNITWNGAAGETSYQATMPLDATANPSYSVTVIVSAAPNPITVTKTVTVVASDLANLTIGGPGTVSAGADNDYSVTGKDQYGNAVVVPAVDWNTNQGTISNGRLSGATKAGAVQISAQAAGITASKSINVIAGNLAKVDIIPASVVLTQGENVTFTAKGYDAFGNLTADSFAFVSSLGNSSSIVANAPAGKYLVTAYNGAISGKAEIIISAKYSNLVLNMENGKAVLSAKDELGKIFTLTNNDYDSVAYDVTGKEDGNSIAADGTFNAGAQEGNYTVTATIQSGGQALSASQTVSIDKGAPHMTIKIDNQDFNNNIVISSRPKFEINMTDGNGIKAVRVMIDGQMVPSIAISAAGVNSSSAIASFTSSQILADGNHNVVIEAEDNLGTKGSVSAFNIKVLSTLQIVGKPVNYPNPFKPATGQSTTINFTLSQAATNLKLSIYDLAGRAVYSRAITGLLGENEVTWDGKNLFGEIVANGAYVYFITENGKVLGKGTMAIYE